MPFEKLVEELQPRAQPVALAALSGHARASQNEPPAGQGLSGLEARALGAGGGSAKFDLLLAVKEAGGRLHVAAEYSADLFDEETVGRMLEHFRTLLEGVVARPEELVGSLPLLTPEERRLLLVEWNDTASEPTAARGLHEPFERQRTLTPDAVAVVCGEERLTYAQLDARAERLADSLRSRGVGPESLVGVMLERTAELVVTLLGVLKSGAAYVPLDPNYPAERLSFMAEDSGMAVLLTEEHLRGRVPPTRAAVIAIDSDWTTDAERDGTARRAPAAPDSLAYVIYTSGSTGRPKGVAITHKSALVLLDWAQRVFTREELSGVLASTSVCFDLSVFELFVPLSCGGAVILAENALQLPEQPSADTVTLINTVPSAMAELVRSGGVPSGVLTVNLAGEALKNQLVQQVYSQTRAEHVWNLYGPSEDTTYSTAALTHRGASREPSIGRPVSGTSAYVLDAQSQPTPLGVAGELHLAGEGLARGYLSRPSLTAERFLPDPFSKEPGGRMYRTGDLSRWRSDGEIEFLGRVDHQVKIRGFRIELGEIEAALRAHASVDECVVVAREAAAGDLVLVAYVAARSGGGLTPGELREHLRERLPGYMTPSFFVFLDALPLTPNGKVDRKALPAPGAAIRAEGEGVRAAQASPRTPVEEVLCGVWAEVLGVGRVGVEDNFFESGGHSLLATQAVARIRNAFGIELPLRSLFERPTPRALAVEVESLLADEGARQLPPLQARGDSGARPLSFAQQRLWFIDQLEPGSPLYNMPSALRLYGGVNLSALSQALREVVRRHEALRTRFIAIEGEAAQVVDATPEGVLRVVDLRGLPETRREAAAAKSVEREAVSPFDLASGPLLRSVLMRLGEDEHVLLVTMHHIVSDGWSMDVLTGEITSLYEAFTAGAQSPLAELPVQYADYAEWQRGWLQGEALEEQLSYWRRQLEGAPPVLELPTDRPRPPLRTYRGAAEDFALSRQATDELKALARSQDATLFMTMLAAFQVLLSRYTNQTDIVVGTPVAGRRQVEVEDLVGFFVNTLVLRSEVRPGVGFGALLRQVRETALGAYAHQDVPFEKLVEELRPERSLSHSPLFQVMLVLGNTKGASAEARGLSNPSVRDADRDDEV